MSHLKLYLPCLVFALSLPAIAQSSSLSDAQIDASIQKGLSEKPQNVGLRLSDTSSLLLSQATGFGVYLYTPATWIEYEAAQSHHLMKPFTALDVTEDMKRPVIRVMAHASTPKKVDAAGMKWSSNVDHVVLQNATKKVIVQPIKETPEDEMVASAVSSQFSMHGQLAEFAPDDLAKVRGSNGDAEFFITVIGKDKKDFKVKAKDFAKL